MKNSFRGPFKKRFGWRLTPFMIAGIYALVGGFWILASDNIVNRFSNDPDIITDIQTYKGWLYVLLTAAMLSWLIRRYGSRLISVANSLQESEARYRIVAETAMDAIITVDSESRIKFSNPAVERIFGYSQAELFGKPLTMLMPERYRQRHLDAVRQYIDTGKKRVLWEHVEFLGLHKGGKEIPLEISFADFKAKGGHFFIGIVRDITERKQTEEALRESQRQNAFLARPA